MSDKHEDTSNETIKKITNFHLTGLKRCGVTVIQGGRGTGKSTIGMNILHHNANEYSYVFVLSKTADVNGIYSFCIPSSCIYKNWNEDKLRTFVQRQGLMAMLKKDGHPLFKDKNIRALVYLDDVMSIPDWTKNEVISDIFFNGRWYQIDFIICVQDPSGIDKKYRDQVDTFISLGADSLSKIKQLHEYYWKHTWGNLNKFSDLLDRCTVDNRAMVLDNSCKGVKELEKRVFKYKALPIHELPVFRIGCDELWAAHAQHFDPNYSPEKDLSKEEREQEKKEKARKKNKQSDDYEVTED